MSVPQPTTPDRPTLARDAVAIVLTGIALGLAFNLVGLASRPPHGLPWIAKAETLQHGDSAQAASPTRVPSPRDDASAARDPGPLAARALDRPVAPATKAAPRASRASDEGEPPPNVDLPAIPDVGRPLGVGLATVAAFVDAGAALVVDARERTAFAAGHIPGSVNVPYDEAARDPAPLRALDAKGRPVIVYCSGGDCEASRMLADLMMRDIGLRRVLVYEAGFPDWLAAGKPVERTTP